MARARLERMAGLALFAFSVGYFVLAFGIRLPGSSDDSPLSARSLPFLLGVLGMGLSALVVLRPPPGEEVAWNGLWWGRAAVLLVLMGLYAWAIPTLGFVVTSALFLALGFRTLGERRLGLLGTVAISVAVSFHVAFWLLDVQLDWGVFEDWFP